jgi:hypothetical protein
MVRLQPVAGRAAEQAGGEYQKVFRIKGVGLGGHPVPHELGVGAQPPQIKFGFLYVGFNLLNVAMG